jgi:hypothetical protein
MNALTIADALAARYAPGTLSPPSGYPAMRVSTARLPNTIPTSPWVLVLPPNGEHIYGSGVVERTLTFRVQFHYAKHTGDVGRDVTGMLAWLGPLLAATDGQYRLGVGDTQHVKSALAAEHRWAVFTYGGDEFYGWEIDVIVMIRDEPVTLVP